MRFLEQSESHRQKVEQGCRRLGEAENGELSFNGFGASQFCKGKNILEMGGGGDGSAMWKYLMPLN